jgi:hypothetical protein
MALPSRSVPGRWSVRIRATDTLGQTATAARTFRLRPPPEGVVRRAAVSALGRTQHAVRARFVFAARPKRGRQVVVTWYHGGRVVWRAKKKAIRVIDSTLYTLPDGQPSEPVTFYWPYKERGGEEQTIKELFRQARLPGDFPE